MTKILITGGAGSMGKELCFSLAQKGYEVTAFDIPQANYEGLEDKGIQIVKGDITDIQSVSEALKDKKIVLHLAALLPPMSEINEEKTFAVNVNGTKNLVDGILANGNMARLIFSSTVASYGDTTGLEPPVTMQTLQKPNTVYSRSKVAAEQYIIQSDVNYTILRVSGVVLASLMDPPMWPFVADQRVEFICRQDVVQALLGAVDAQEADKKIFIIAGGPTWQMKGMDFVRAFFKILDIPEEDAEFPEEPVYSDWYDTVDSQRTLGYQQTSFEEFLKLLEEAVNQEIYG